VKLLRGGKVRRGKRGRPKKHLFGNEMKLSLAFCLATACSAFTPTPTFTGLSPGLRVGKISTSLLATPEVPSMKKYLETLVEGKDLEADDTQAIFTQILEE
jgi:hypothetical protein